MANPDRNERVGSDAQTDAAPRGDAPAQQRDGSAKAPGGGRTGWQERTQPQASDAPTEDELRGLSILGGNDVRDGAISGVSEPVRDGSAGPDEREQ